MPGPNPALGLRPSLVISDTGKALVGCLSRSSTHTGVGPSVPNAQVWGTVMPSHPGAATGLRASRGFYSPVCCSCSAQHAAGLRAARIKVSALYSSCRLLWGWEWGWDWGWGLGGCTVLLGVSHILGVGFCVLLAAGIGLGCGGVWQPWGRGDECVGSWGCTPR